MPCLIICHFLTTLEEQYNVPNNLIQITKYKEWYKCRQSLKEQIDDDDDDDNDDDDDDDDDNNNDAIATAEEVP